MAGNPLLRSASVSKDSVILLRDIQRELVISECWIVFIFYFLEFILDVLIIFDYELKVNNESPMGLQWDSHIFSIHCGLSVVIPWMNGWMDCREAYVARRFVHSLANTLLSCLLFFLLSSFLLLYYLLSFSLISLFRPFLPWSVNFLFPLT